MRDAILFLTLLFLVSSVAVCVETKDITTPDLLPNTDKVSMVTWDFLTVNYIYDSNLIHMSSQGAYLQEAPNWYDHEWMYRMKLSYNNEQGDHSLTSVQCIVRLSEENFSYSHAAPNGDDLRFTDEEGTRWLSYWIESWNPGGISQIWVTLPFVPFGSNYTFYLYYGNSTASPQSCGLNVFENQGFDDFESYRIGPLQGQFPTAQEQWQQINPNPVFGSGDGLYGFSSIVKSDSIYHMYYTGNNVVGHAISMDGIHWQNVGIALTNAVVSTVWKEAAQWYMLYRHYIPSAGRYGIGLATSTNGYYWTKYVGNPVLTESSSDWFCGIEPWGIIKNGSVYYLYYNDWNSAVGQRKTGIATSTDLYHWVKNPANPIFVDGRFCPFPFQYGEYFYLIIPHYTSWDDYSTLELYRDHTPEFKPESRELVKIVENPGSLGSWNYQDQDTPFILCDDIYRNSFAVTNNQLWMYYAGAPYNQPATWYTGLSIGEDISAAVTPVKQKPAWNYGYRDNTVIMTQTHDGFNGKVIYVPVSEDISLFCDVNRTTNSTVQVWMYVSQANSREFNLVLQNASHQTTAGLGMGLSHFSYFDAYSNCFVESSIEFSRNTWYLISLELKGYRYNAVAYNEDYQVVFRMEDLQLQSCIMFAGISADGMDAHSKIGYIDDFQVLSIDADNTRSANIDLNEEMSYPNNNPTIQPNHSADVTAVDGFSQTATENGGQIRYVISNDNGVSWFYWANGLWLASDESFDNTSTVEQINAHLSDLPFGKGRFLWRAYLHSDGVFPVILNSISLEYTTPNLETPTNLHAQVASNSMSLQWDSVPNAVLYRVYESENLNGPWVQTATTTTPGIIRPVNGTTSQRFYRITAE